MRAMTEGTPFHNAALDEDEKGVERSLRPPNLEAFTGQRPIVENLRIAIHAARERGDVLDHILFSGMPGLGKTTLAGLIAGEMGGSFHITSGPALDKAKDVVGLLCNLKPGDVLFIDEIHQLSRETEEILYSAMEDFKVDLLLGTGPEARALRLSIEPFCLVGATTREGALSAPFRSRFGITEKFELYSSSDLVEIIRRSARLLGCRIGDAASLYLAERCRGTPRYANRFLRRVRDLAQFRSPRDRREATRDAEPIDLTDELVEEGLERQGIDRHGLDRLGRRILEVLLQHDEPVGLKTIALSVGEEERTVEDVYEPFLIQRGLILKTPRGRKASARAYELYRALGRLYS